MAFTLPVFNLTANVWNTGNVPSGSSPDFTGVACQFYIYSRVSVDVQPCELELYTPLIQIRLPIAAATPWVNGQVFEVVGGSGRFYRARFKDRLHYGFPNEYLVAYVVQCDEDGRPLIRDIEGAVPCDVVSGRVGAGTPEVSAAIVVEGLATHGDTGHAGFGQFFPDAGIESAGQALHG
jgi:hypothetical protein